MKSVILNPTLSLLSTPKMKIISFESGCRGSNYTWAVGHCFYSPFFPNNKWKRKCCFSLQGGEALSTWWHCFVSQTLLCPEDIHLCFLKCFQIVPIISFFSSYLCMYFLVFFGLALPFCCDGWAKCWTYCDQD